MSAGARPRVADLLPAVMNGIRCFAAVAAVSVLWVVSAWPQGPSAVLWAAIIVLIQTPRAEAAYQGSLAFLVGTLVSACLAAVADFAVLPGREGFEASGAGDRRVHCADGGSFSTGVAEDRIRCNDRELCCVDGADE